MLEIFRNCKHSTTFHFILIRFRELQLLVNLDNTNLSVCLSALHFSGITQFILSKKRLMGLGQAFHRTMFGLDAIHYDTHAHNRNISSQLTIHYLIIIYRSATIPIKDTRTSVLSYSDVPKSYVVLGGLKH